MKLPDELERAWSRALESSAVTQGLEALDVRLRSLFDAIVLMAEADDEDLKISWPAAGIDWTAIVDGDIAQSALQSVAQVVVVAEVADQLRALREPSTEVLDLMTGQSETVWESGAFSRLRAQVASLQRLLPGRDTSELTLCLERVDAARRALALGLPEAALLYIKMALPLVIPILAGPHRAEQRGDASDSSKIEEADVQTAFGDAAPAIDLLERSVADMADGKQPDAAITVLLAHGLTDRITDLVNARVFGAGPALRPDTQ